jgi:putative ABC transport system permease protein
MKVLQQIVAVTALNVRSIPRRMGTSAVVVLGIAGVVGVLVSVFGMTQSMSQTVLAAGSPDRAIVLRSGATSDFASTLLIDAVATIMDAPGVARTPEGDAVASAEMVTAVNMLRKENGTRSGVSIRGVSEQGFAVRPEIELVEGRMFTPGLREIIVGRGAHAEFAGLAVGDEVALRDSRWKVVGVYGSGGNIFESGILADSATLRSAYQRTAVNNVTVRLSSPAAFDEFKTALTTDPTLSVTVERELDYYGRQSQNASRFFGFVTTFVSGIMALGALFAALNTMYSAVSTRGVEIATLRALGFGASGVVVSVLAEALLLSFLGAVLGAGVAWALFGGNEIAMGGNGGTLVFSLDLTPELLGLGVALACSLGFLGAVLPAVRAARLPVATALRAL